MISTKQISKTRKQHQCELCLDVLPQGSKAVALAGINEDNDFFHGYLCLTCYSLWNDHDFYKKYLSDGWYVGDMKSYADVRGFDSVAEMANHWNEHKTIWKKEDANATR